MGCNLMFRERQMLLFICNHQSALDNKSDVEFDSVQSARKESPFRTRLSLGMNRQAQTLPKP